MRLTVPIVITLAVLTPAAPALAGRSTGSATCTACKTCQYCAHCAGGGGTCGVCARTPAARGKSGGGSAGYRDSHARSSRRSPPSLPAGRRAIICVRDATFRTAPEKAARRIRTLPKGTPVTVVGEQSGYYKLLLRDGSKGWTPTWAVAL